MANNQHRHGATANQIEFWMLIHQILDNFVDLGGRDLAARSEWGEQNVHDALVVMHAIAHATMDGFGFTPWPDCPLGDGSDVALQVGLQVVIPGGDA